MTLKDLDADAIWQRLEILMKYRGVKNQRELAKLLSISQPAISKWFKQNSPRAATLTNLCTKLNVRLDWLLYGKGEADFDTPDDDYGWIEIAANRAENGKHKNLLQHASAVDRRVASVKRSSLTIIYCYPHLEKFLRKLDSLGTHKNLAKEYRKIMAPLVARYVHLLRMDKKLVREVTSLWQLKNLEGDVNEILCADSRHLLNIIN